MKKKKKTTSASAESFQNEPAGLKEIDGSADDFEKTALATLASKGTGAFATQSGSENAPNHPQQKRGPGRPKGWSPKKQRNTDHSTMNSSVDSFLSESQPPAPVDYALFLTTPLLNLSKIPAQRTGVPELALSPDEAKAIAESFSGVVNAFFPDLTKLDPKTAAVVMFGATTVTILATKWDIYNQHQAKLAANNTQPVQQKTEAPAAQPQHTQSHTPHPSNVPLNSDFFNRGNS